jgi:hypothetical protein
MLINRRSLLTCGALVPLMDAVPHLARAADEAANYTLRIGSGLVEPP